MKYTAAKYYKKVAAFLVSCLVMTCATLVFAADAPKPVTYTPLEPNAFPGVKTSTGNLGAFLGSIFSFGIAVAVALALVMIILGGIEYMTTDSWEKKDSGKQRIQNALWGLGLALISWLLLYTINPNLVTFKGNLLLGGK